MTKVLKTLACGVVIIVAATAALSGDIFLLLWITNVTKGSNWSVPALVGWAVTNLAIMGALQEEFG